MFDKSILAFNFLMEFVDNPIYAYFLIQYILFTLYFPIAVKYLHHFGRIQYLLVWVPALIIPHLILLVNFSVYSTTGVVPIIPTTPDPIFLTPSTESQRLADALTVISNDLGCTGTSRSVNSREASLYCELAADTFNRVYFSFSLIEMDTTSWGECFHGYPSRSDEFWYANGVEYYVTVNDVDGYRNAELHSTLREQAFETLVRLNLLANEGGLCQ